MPQPLDQIGVGDERTPEHHQIGPSRCHGLLRRFGGEAARQDQRAAVGRAERFLEGGRAQVARMDIGQIALCQCSGQREPCGFLALEGIQVTEPGERRDAHADALGTDVSGDAIDRLQQQPQAIGDGRAAVGIFTGVESAIDELLEQVAIACGGLAGTWAGWPASSKACTRVFVAATATGATGAVPPS